MPNDVPPTKTTLTPRQRNAAALLTRYLKDAHENLHGPGSWLSSDDDNVKQLVEDLIDPEEVARHFVKQLQVRTRRR